MFPYIEYFIYEEIINHMECSINLKQYSRPLKLKSLDRQNAGTTQTNHS